MMNETTVETIEELISAFHLRLTIQKDLSSINQIKSILDKTIDPNSNEYVIYKLLLLRYNIFFGDKEKARHYYNDLNTTSLIENHKHYYYFFRGLFEFYVSKDYIEALKLFKQADTYVILIKKGYEKADFYYHFSALYYHLRKPLLALKYVSVAKQIYKMENKAREKVVSCEIIEGLCYLTTKSFSEAELIFKNALETTNDPEIKLYITYNLGLLYSEIGDSYESIKYLSIANEKDFGSYKTLFLLAKEQYKLKNYSAARECVRLGLEKCLETDEEYVHHFNVCRFVYDDDQTNTPIEESIEYFERMNLWGFAEDYSLLIAEKYLRDNNISKALYYYHKGFTSKQKQFEVIS